MLAFSRFASLTDIEAHHPGTSDMRLEQRCEDPHGRRLASAVGSEQCEYAARLNLQVETVQGDRRPKALDQALGVDGKPVFEEVQDVKVSDPLDPLADMEKQAAEDWGVGSPQYRWHLAFAASRVRHATVGSRPQATALPPAAVRAAGSIGSRSTRSETAALSRAR